MSPKQRQSGPSVSHESRHKSIAISGRHVIKSWIPPTSLCGQMVEGIAFVNPGYENEQWDGPECNKCKEIYSA